MLLFLLFCISVSCSLLRRGSVLSCVKCSSQAPPEPDSPTIDDWQRLVHYEVQRLARLQDDAGHLQFRQVKLLAVEFLPPQSVFALGNETATLADILQDLAHEPVTISITFQEGENSFWQQTLGPGGQDTFPSKILPHLHTLPSNSLHGKPMALALPPAWTLGFTQTLDLYSFPRACQAIVAVLQNLGQSLAWYRFSSILFYRPPPGDTVIWHFDYPASMRRYLAFDPLNSLVFTGEGTTLQQWTLMPSEASE